MTRYITLIIVLVLLNVSILAQDATITIHLREVAESKITLLPLAGSNALKPLLVIDGIKNGEDATLKIPAENLPGEFVLRFDYKEKPTSTPYPSEKRIIVSKQNLELWVSPVYCNNPDSTWFQPDERENRAYSVFIQENTRQKQMLGLLQNFLLNYDDTSSEFYRGGIKEYEKRRKSNNLWIDEQIKLNKTLFAGSMFGFQKVPDINWTGDEAKRKQSLRENYFSEIDFSNPTMIKTSSMKQWMDGYVNLFGELATSVPLRDSLFTLAGKTAIEKARKGNPLVYGWMVDYFFNGFESFNIEKGIQMLQPYLDDPDCLTTKRQEINKRLKGIETLVPGTIAPDIILQDADNKAFELYKYQTEKKYLIILFWSADCSHCDSLTGELFAWYQNQDLSKKPEIVAISLDETDSEIQAWHRKINGFPGWIHLRAAEGVRSKVANDYFILSVPVMIVVDAKTMQIVSLPETVDQLNGL